MKHIRIKWLLIPLLVAAIVGGALIPRSVAHANSGGLECSGSLAFAVATGWAPGTPISVSVGGTVVSSGVTDALGNATLGLNTSSVNSVIITGTLIDGVTIGSVSAGPISCPLAEPIINSDPNIGSRIDFNPADTIAVYCKPAGFVYTYMEIWQTVPEAKFVYGAELGEFRRLFANATPTITAPFAAGQVLLSRAATQDEAAFGITGYGVVATLGTDGNSVTISNGIGSKSFTLTRCAALAGRSYLPTPTNVAVAPQVAAPVSSGPATSATTLPGISGGTASGTTTAGIATNAGGGITVSGNNNTTIVGPGGGAVNVQGSGNTTYVGDVAGFHTVNPGETLFSIAQRYGTSVANIVAANPQYANNTRLVYAGSQLAIPTGTSVGVTASPSRPAGTLYVVQRGDWIYQIARNFNTTPQAIIAANPQLRNPSAIMPGDTLVIP